MKVGAASRTVQLAFWVQSQLSCVRPYKDGVYFPAGGYNAGYGPRLGDTPAADCANR